MLKAKSSENFLVQKFAKFWPFRGPGDQGVWKVAIFTAKGTSLRESTSIEAFCVKIGWGVWPPGVSRKKSQKVSDSHRNDVSPLTQGLRYRAACDNRFVNSKSHLATDDGNCRQSSSLDVHCSRQNFRLPSFRILDEIRQEVQLPLTNCLVFSGFE